MIHLGQYFLINKSVIKKIIAALDLQPNDIVIEIGPGKGALTIPLAEECQNLKCKIIAIEKDKKLFEKLVNSNWQLEKNIEFILGDALKIIPKLITNYQLPVTNYKIVGNIPYYITGKLLRLLGDLITNYSRRKVGIPTSLSKDTNSASGQLPITAIVLMLQKEVAERIIARPPKMNLLAAAVQFWAEPKILFSLKPKDFSPPPKVNSAVIKLESRIQNLESRITENYYKFIRILFKQPRKTILNNLSTSDVDRLEIENMLRKLKIDPQSRPQNLSIEQIKQLASLLH